jgi:hypothetical protein
MIDDRWILPTLTLKELLIQERYHTSKRFLLTKVPKKQSSIQGQDFETPLGNLCAHTIELDLFLIYL